MWRWAMWWQLWQMELPGSLCLAWYALVWHFPQLVIPEPTAVACSFCEWQELQTLLLVTVAECCAWAPPPVPVPLWQVAHLLCGTFLPWCFIEWQLVQPLKPGVLAWYWWNAAAVGWQVVQATLPACWARPMWQKLQSVKPC